MSRTLRLEGLHHRYAGSAVDTLAGIDLEVGAGEMVAILGPSGSGKSTLLRLAAGLEAPRSGRVWLGEREVTAAPPDRRGLTLVSQRPHLFEHFSVLDNVAFGPRVSGSARRAARRRARDHLDLVHLGDLAQRRPAQLSGGQQQRVALARALATGSPVLLLDEPFASLDRPLRSSMHALLAELRAAVDPTVVMVTHDLDEAALADRVGVLVGGRLHQVAPAAELYRRPASAEVVSLVGGFNRVPGRVEESGSRPVHVSAGGRWPLPEDCPVRGPADLLVRREDLSASLADPADSADAATWTVTGRVAALTPLGARTVATVEAVGLSVTVELPLRAGAEIGSELTLGPVTGAEVWALEA